MEGQGRLVWYKQFGVDMCALCLQTWTGPQTHAINSRISVANCYRTLHAVAEAGRRCEAVRGIEALTWAGRIHCVC